MSCPKCVRVTFLSTVEWQYSTSCWNTWKLMTSSEMSESSVPSYFSQSVTPNGKQLHVNVINTRPCWYFHHLRLFVCSADLFLGTLLIFSARCGQDSKPPASESHCQIWCQSQVTFIRPHRTQASVYESRSPRQYQRCCWLFVKRKT